MKKKNLLAGSFMLAVVAATGGYHAFNSNSPLEGNLLMENVEALATGDEATIESCTRASKTAPCYEDVFIGYKPNTTTPIIIKMQTHFKITEVKPYTVNSQAEICLHETVTEC